MPHATLREGAYGLKRDGVVVTSDEFLSELTPREQEVAALIGQGLSNEQIARRLLLTRGTVANHVAHILAKTGARSRWRIECQPQYHRGAGVAHPPAGARPTSRAQWARSRAIGLSGAPSCSANRSHPHSGTGLGADGRDSTVSKLAVADGNVMCRIAYVRVGAIRHPPFDACLDARTWATIIRSN
jgi:hypothetical protein